MNDLEERLVSLTDEEVAQLTIWLFNKERASVGDVVAITKLGHFTGDIITPAFEERLKELGISPFRKRPGNRSLVMTFRSLLLDYARTEHDVVARRIDELGLEAGPFSLTDILSNVNITEIFLIIVLLSSHFKASYSNKQGKTKLEIEFSSPLSNIKDFLRSLSIFKENELFVQKMEKVAERIEVAGSVVGKKNQSIPKSTIMSGKRFLVALSFPGEYRQFVASVAETLSRELGQEKILYDKYHEAEFARLNLGTYLPYLYHDQSELVVVFLCAEYEKKEWTGLEWRAILDLIKKKRDELLMFIRFDDTEIPGVYTTDGYVDARGRKPAEIAALILERLRTLQRERTPNERPMENV
jgi:hypothetical protein